ncbi:MAG: oligosaccharide flippase family protein [Gemmatimonadales bacterium]|nr:oligosaccharide flippase family protein [Gemmatimonadales bacterium]
MPAGSFAHSVAMLATGTAIGQLLLALAVPVLARLYTPADYGALAVYSSTLAVLAVLASLRYEVAIPLAEDDEVAGSLLALTLLLLAAMAALVSLLVWLGGGTFVAAVKVPALRPYLWLIPVAFLATGAYQALSYWAIRRRAFGHVARTRLSQGTGQVVTQVAAGLAGAGTPGLLIGDLIGRAVGGGGLALLAWRDRPSARVTRASLVKAAVRYRRFPLLTTWSGLLNVGSLQLPSILFAAGFGAAAAGLYGLSFKMLVLPTMLVAQAVGQVFVSRAAAAAREPERLRQLTERTTLALFACGLPVFGVVALGGPRLFAILMGAEWELAGRYAQVLAPWFALWLVSSPLSGLLSIREWQGSALAFSAVEFTLRLGALLAGIRRGSPMLAVALLSASGIVISVASIGRFLVAGHSSIGRLLDPAVRLLALATACLLPTAIALHIGRERLAIVAGVLALAAYYTILARSAVASRVLHLRADPRASGA